ncbi:hypothetical protein SAMN04489716_3738 [Actinoplanes derwentensis]|uniref:Uncharacterized protein n=1 Tax=Actinoplanes derwentensis TaxID=113562 RepID=A0A1H2A9Y8_9ACTN|nr:hypothetical protein Ade03nite_73700 [Actinoplanes derwentensis]SDT42592.1 hypothetical protein SAMN04489716_3738 [Actinoplanes derwentensis]
MPSDPLTHDNARTHTYARSLALFFARGNGSGNESGSENGSGPGSGNVGGKTNAGRWPVPQRGATG